MRALGGFVLVAAISLTGCSTQIPAIHEAARTGDLDTVRALVQKHPDKVDRRWKSFINATPLYIAARQTDVAKYLIQQGADVNAEDTSGRTPIFRAAYVGNVELARLLVSKGAKITVTTPCGYTPLHSAADGGHTNTISFLIAGGADVNGRTEWGGTPLHLAAKHDDQRYLAAVKLLLQNGSNINVTNRQGETALHHAVIYNDSTEPMVRLLLQNGADAAIKDSAGLTPMSWARMKKRQRTLQILQEHDASKTER